MDKDRVHPRSRKANQLNRAQLRIGKLDTRKNVRNTVQVFPLCTRSGYHVSFSDRSG